MLESLVAGTLAYLFFYKHMAPGPRLALFSAIGALADQASTFIAVYLCGFRESNPLVGLFLEPVWLFLLFSLAKIAVTWYAAWHSRYGILAGLVFWAAALRNTVLLLLVLLGG